MNVQKLSFGTYGIYGSGTYGRKVLEKRLLPKQSPGINRIYYIHDGWIDMRLADKTVRLKKGHLYLIPNALNNTMYIKYVDHTFFDFSTFPRINNTEHIDVCLSEYPVLEACLHAMSLYVENFPRHLVSDEEHTDFMVASLKNFLFLLGKKEKITCSKDDLIETVVAYIHGHYTSKISVTELAVRFHMEESVFIRRFKQCTAMTPYHYIKLLRVNQARILIKNGGRTLDEIARIVGYADGPTLSHALKNCQAWQI